MRDEAKARDLEDELGARRYWALDIGAEIAKARESAKVDMTIIDYFSTPFGRDRRLLLCEV